MSRLTGCVVDHNCELWSQTNIYCRMFFFEYKFSKIGKKSYFSEANFYREQWVPSLEMTFMDIFKIDFIFNIILFFTYVCFKDVKILLLFWLGSFIWLYKCSTIDMIHVKTNTFRLVCSLRIWRSLKMSLSI